MRTPSSRNKHSVEDKAKEIVIMFMFRFQTHINLNVNQLTVRWSPTLVAEKLAHNFAREDVHSMSPYLTRLLQNFVNWDWLR